MGWYSKSLSQGMSSFFVIFDVAYDFLYIIRGSVLVYLFVDVVVEGGHSSSLGSQVGP